MMVYIEEIQAEFDNGSDSSIFYRVMALFSITPWYLVSVQYLLKGLSDLNEISFADLYLGNTGQVR